MMRKLLGYSSTVPGQEAPKCQPLSSFILFLPDKMKPAVLFDLRIEGAYIHNLLHTATREVLLVTCTIL
jgi:hypothetical protein